MKLIAYHIISIEGARYLTFPALEQCGLRLMLSTADSYRAEDSVSDKIAQLQRAYAQFGTQQSQVFAGYQVHGTQIAQIASVSEHPADDSYFRHEFDATDGLITTAEDATLLTKFADCTPIVLFDPKARVLCSLHSGWRGSQARISARAVRILQERYSVAPSDLIAFLGPSIGAAHFEVRADLVAQFLESHGDIAAYLKPHTADSYLFDLRALLLDDLTALGIPTDQIYITDLETYANPMLHSYRRDGKNSGRMLLFARMEL